MEIGLNGLYGLSRRFFRFNDSDARGAYWFYCATDLAMVRTWNEAEMYRSNMRANAMPAEMWNRPYQMIDRASAIIDAAPGISMQTETVHIRKSRTCPVGSGYGVSQVCHALIKSRRQYEFVDHAQDYPEQPVSHKV